MKLYGYWRSSCSWRVRTALYLKGLVFESVPVHLVKDGGAQNSAAYLRINPTGTVPLLEVIIDGETRWLAQSMAIISYLEAIQPLPALFPPDAFLAAKARELAEIVNSGIQPFQNLSVLQYVKARHQDDKAWAQHWIARGLGALEKAATKTAGKYTVGDTVTVADLYLVPQLYNARRFQLDLTPYPTLLRAEAACAALDAFAASHPDVQPDAEK